MNPGVRIAARHAATAVARRSRRSRARPGPARPCPALLRMSSPSGQSKIRCRPPEPVRDSHVAGSAPCSASSSARADCCRGGVDPRRAPRRRSAGPHSSPIPRPVFSGQARCAAETDGTVRCQPEISGCLPTVPQCAAAFAASAEHAMQWEHGEPDPGVGDRGGRAPMSTAVGIGPRSISGRDSHDLDPLAPRISRSKQASSCARTLPVVRSSRFARFVPFTAAGWLMIPRTSCGPSEPRFSSSRSVASRSSPSQSRVRVSTTRIS